MYRGLAPVAVAARIGDVDSAVTDYLKKFFEQGGVPAGLLSSKLKLTDPAVADIRRRWRERYGGWRNWMEPAVLDSDAQYQRMALSFQEMGFEVLDARDETRICTVLRVPPILVGAQVGMQHATYSNYEQARRAWWQDDLTPQYKRLGDECNNDLAREFGDDIELRWDFSAVEALQEDLNTRYTRAREALVTGAIMVNEYREAIGLARVNGGDVFLRTLTQYEVPASLEGSRKALALPAGETKADDDEMPDARGRRQAERALKGELQGHFDAQLERIRQAVANGN
jgi:HK97 family phage portal protein